VTKLNARFQVEAVRPMSAGLEMLLT